MASRMHERIGVECTSPITKKSAAIHAAAAEFL
jgi:hypothetical protein